VGDFQRFLTADGLEVYLLPTQKFKTKLVRIHFRALLDGDCCARALVPNLLRRGSKSYPSMVEVSRALEALYGASWSSSTFKIAQEQVLSMRMDVVDERFLPGQPPLTQEALGVMREFLFEPRLEGESFPSESFEQERRNLRHELLAQYNDKMTYAFQRFAAEMFPGDPYGKPVLGTPEDTDRLTPEGVYQTWHDLLQQPARLYLVGDYDWQPTLDWVSSRLPMKSFPRESTEAPRQPAAEPRVICEDDEISQSKLILGFHVDLTDLDEVSFDALRLFSSILGGGFHSRLFQTVREKHSLAYYASASIDRLKGVLYASCGIDANRREQVCDLIMGELASLQKEPPREDELQQARLLAIAGTRSAADSAGAMVDSLEAGLAGPFSRRLRQIAESLQTVTADDIWRAAQRISPAQVIYCLQGEARHDTY
jgi:predicted Zn-dependent peptidase